MTTIYILKMGSTFPELLCAYGDFEQWIIDGLHYEPTYGTATWGVQFHPEFSPEITRQYVFQCHKKLRLCNLDPDLTLQSVRETPTSASVLPHFYNYCKDNGFVHNG